MTEPVVAAKVPAKVTLEAGKDYWWCACGKSAKQPFCDGSHKGTGLKSIMWKAEADETVWLCGCKASTDRPFCDGTHNGL